MTTPGAKRATPNGAAGAPELSAPELTEAEFLSTYTAAAYDRPSVTADVVLFTIRQGQLSILLVERGDHPYRGCWALPGGFVQIDESTEQAARRELGEETGLGDFSGHLEQLRTYDAVDRDPRTRVLSVAYLAMMPDLPLPRAGSDAAAARWWAVEDLGLDGTNGALPLAFDHAQIIADGLERVRAKLEYTALATSFVTEPFTLGELRRVYEAVWGVPQQFPNFRRKILSVEGFVVPLGEKAKDRGAPDLYRAGTAVILQPPIRRETEGA